MTQLKSITQITLLCSGNPQSHLEQERCVCFQWAVMNTLLCGWLPVRLLENGTVTHNSICCAGVQQCPDCLLQNSRDYLPAIDFILPMGNLQFAVSSESEHVTSSPHHSQSNGRVLYWSSCQECRKTTEKHKVTADAMQISSGHRIGTCRNNNMQTGVVPDAVQRGDNALLP